jgi:hypothetical protein
MMHCTGAARKVRYSLAEAMAAQQRANIKVRRIGIVFLKRSGTAIILHCEIQKVLANWRGAGSGSGSGA